MTFSFAEQKNFDKHIRDSIPGYNVLTTDVAKLAESFIEPDTCVLDIGCTSGKMLFELQQKAEIYAHYIGIDIVQTDEWKKMQKTFTGQSAQQNLGKLEYLQQPVQEYLKSGRQHSVIISLFTLQFIPITQRRKVLEDIRSELTQDAAFIFAEKVYSENSKVQDCLTFMHYDFKRQNFTEEEILKKEKELRSHMRLLTIGQIKASLTEAGFKSCDTFWQHNNFVGFIAQSALKA
jgi:tRNA (cmo5U34)-methyltransferase